MQEEALAAARWRETEMEMEMEMKREEEERNGGPSKSIPVKRLAVATEKCFCVAVHDSGEDLNVTGDPDVVDCCGDGKAGYCQGFHCPCVGAV